MDEAPGKKTWMRPRKCYENMAIDNIFAIIASVGSITIWELVQKTIFKY